MTAINEMLQQPAAQAIGWALLQFVWQGTLIGLVTAALLAALRRSAADVRYVVATIALSLMLTMPVVTAVQAFRGAAAASDATTVAASVVTARTETSIPRFAPAPVADDATSSVAGLARPTFQFEPFEQWLPLLVSVWLAGVAMLTLRLLSSWMWVQRMKAHGAAPAGDAIQRLADRLTRRLHISRTVRLLESPLVDVPTVVGWIKPVVLLPVSALSGLTPRQLEAILAHELAHIRRHDYVVNLLQTVVETLLFYHPAVWWLSRRIRTEREHCCDDLAVSLCGDPVTYAAALAELEGLRGGSNHLVLAASGGSLLQRVRRVLGAPSHEGRAPGWLAAGVAILVIVGISAGALGRGVLRAETLTFDAGQLPPPPPPPAPPTAPAPPPPPVPTALSDDELAMIARSLAETARDQSRAVVAEARRVMETARDAVQLAAGATVASTEPIEHAIRAMVATAGVATTHADAALAEVARAIQTAQAGATTAGPPAVRSRDDQRSGNYIWSNDGQKLEVNYRGDVEFSDDDSDVRSMTPGGWLRIRDVQRAGTDYAVEFRADAGGNIERRFWVGNSERPLDAEGRKWLAQILPRFIRQSGIGAAGRVARIMKSKGVPGVLAEISLIEGSWAKRLYSTELLKIPSLNSRAVQQVLEQAGKEIDSDFELASLLISADKPIADDATRRAFLDAARTISSDFETRRVFSAVLKNGPLTPAILASLLDASTSIGSDFEEASLLVQVAKVQPLDAVVRPAFFKALATIDSAFERGRVLKAVLQRTDLSPDALAAVLDASALTRSDFESASVLLEFVKVHPVEGAVRAPFFRAVSSIDSAFERGRVLQAVAKRTDLSDESVLGVIRAAQGITSNVERSQVLLVVAGTHPLTREARDAYIDAAERLGDFEQGRVLSALVKNERRK